MTVKLDRSLGEARSHRMLLALSRAARAMQRARTAEEVYFTVGDEVARLGWHALILTKSGKHPRLWLSHSTLNSTVLSASEELADLRVEGFNFPLEAEGAFQRVTSQGETILFERLAELVAEALPTRLRAHADRLVAQLGLEQGIMAPLVVGGETAGLLVVAGAGLTMKDVSAVTAFASLTALALENAQLLQRLQEEEERFRTSVENMLDCFGIYSAIRDQSGEIVDFRIEYVNGAACQSSQMSREEQVGKRLLELLPAHRETGLFSELCQVIETGRPFAIDAFVYEDEHENQRLERALDLRVTKLGDGVAAAWRNVTERLAEQRELARSRRQIEALWELAYMTDADYQTLCDRILEEIVAMTDSRLGFIGFLDEGVDMMSVQSWSTEAMEECRIRQRPTAKAISESGLWGQAVRQRQTLVINDYQADHPAKRGLPEGHVSLTRILVVPIFGRDQLVALAAVANKEAEYGREDVEQIKAFVTSAYALLQKNKAERALRDSEERYRRLLDSGSEGIITTSPDGRVQSANPAAAAMLGYASPEEVRGMPAIEFFDDPQQEMALAQELTQERHAENVELALRGKGGAQVYVLGSATLQGDSQRDSMRTEYIFMDITERKRAEEEVRLLQEVIPAVGDARDFQSALQIVLSKVCETSGWDYGEAWTPRPDGEVLECSAAWHSNAASLEQFRRASLEMTFRRNVGLPGRVWASMKPEWIEDVSSESEAAFLRAEAAVDVGLRAALAIPLATDGRVLAVLVFFMFETREKDNRFVELVSSVAAQLGSAMQQKWTEEALGKQAAELARSNAELQQFAYVASHDLQEPLRMVASYLELLQRRYRGQLDDDADEFISYAVDGASRMQRLIKDLLDYSRVGTRGNPLKPTDVEAALGQAIANLEAVTKESAAKITYDALPRVMADEGQLAQLFQNLISNAIKFRSMARPEVHIGLERQENEWKFSVRDNGIGFDPEFADRIFLIFQRLHSGGQYPGTGIGLAISKRIVERHGGRIWAESRPGAGSSFCFTLPDHSSQP